jgi:hypothetical protein
MFDFKSMQKELIENLITNKFLEFVDLQHDQGFYFDRDKYSYLNEKNEFVLCEESILNKFVRHSLIKRFTYSKEEIEKIKLHLSKQFVHELIFEFNKVFLEIIEKSCLRTQIIDFSLRKNFFHEFNDKKILINPRLLIRINELCGMNLYSRYLPFQNVYGAKTIVNDLCPANTLYLINENFGYFVSKKIKFEQKYHDLGVTQELSFEWKNNFLLNRNCIKKMFFVEEQNLNKKFQYMFRRKNENSVVKY